MFYLFNPYSNEKGFLANGNFTDYERSLILPITHKSILCEEDIDFKLGGDDILHPASQISEVVGNYDTAYYHNVEDKVFLLSVKELYDYVYKNNDILGYEYYIGKPTKEAISNCTDKTSKLNANNCWSTWLRDPSPAGESFVRNIREDGDIFDYFASCGNYGGTRPALVLKNTTKFNSGDGTLQNPYTIY